MPADTQKVKVFTKISNKLLQINPKESLLYADSALALAKALKDANGIGDAYVRKGLALDRLGDYDEAIANYKLSLPIFKKLKNNTKESRVLNNIGYSHMSLGNYPVSIDYYMQSLNLKKENIDTVGMAASYTNIAIVFAVKSDFDQAAYYFNQAIHLYRLIHDEPMLYKNLLNLGGLYKDQELYEKSIEQIKLVQAYHQKNKNKGEWARCMYIMGANYLALENYPAALKEFTEAKKIYEEIKNNKQIAGCQLKISEVNAKMRNFKQALEDAEIALRKGQSIQSKDIVSRTYKQLSEIYFGMKQYEKAYQLRLLYENLKDSVFNEESNEKILEIEAKFQNKIKQKEIIALQAENKVAALEIKRKNSQNYILAAALLLLLVIGFLVFNQYRIKKNSNDTLQEKNKIIETSLNEKELLLKEIHHRVKNNLQFVWSMLNLQTRHIKDPKTLDVLIEGKNRIKTMALIHQKLYQTNNLTGIDMQQYIPNLVSNIFETYQKEAHAVELITEIDPLVLDIDSALPLGLILNEIITNALKHAFNAQEDKLIEIHLKRKDNCLDLTVKDNGSGLPEALNLETLDNFGLKLVKTLALQLKAEVEIKSEQGTVIFMRIHHFKTT